VLFVSYLYRRLFSVIHGFESLKGQIIAATSILSGLEGIKIISVKT
jgi:hypothetical protein